MNVRGAAVQGGLAALGLLVAYTTWQREPERAPGEVVVLDVEQERRQQGALRGRRASGSSSSGARTADGAGRVAASWPRTTQAEDARARGARQRDAPIELWDKFAPLRATRALGTLDAAKLKELGLDAPKKKVEVTARGGQARVPVRHAAVRRRPIRT